MKFHRRISILAMSMVTGISCFMVPVAVKADGLRTDVTPMYRLYNPNSGEHFYTASTEEEAHLAWLGWRYEGVGWYAPKNGNPVYRLYNANGGEHHYTLNENEKNSLVHAGWKDEGIGWYSDDNKTVALHREYNPNAFANNHNYTASDKEHNHLISLGWKDENIGWYGLSTGSNGGSCKVTTEQKWVEDKPAWDEKVYTGKSAYFCLNCDEYFDDDDPQVAAEKFEKHCSEKHKVPGKWMTDDQGFTFWADGGIMNGYSVRPVYKTVHHDATGHYETITKNSCN